MESNKYLGSVHYREWLDILIPRLD